jgi:replicative DNA helicase
MTLVDQPRGASQRARRNNGRIPPHDLEAEASVLGAAMLSPPALDSIEDTGLCAEDFYRPAHQHIYASMMRLTARGEPIDTITVTHQLRQDGLLDQIGGAAALHALQNATPSISNADRYATLVRQSALLRRLIHAAGDIAELGYDSETSAAEGTLDQAEQRLHRLTLAQHTATVSEADQLLPGWIERLEARVDSGGGITGVSTGLRDLDVLTSGLQPGSLTIVGARPAVGKSAFALGIAAHVAIELRRPVLFVSLEMPHDELLARLVSLLGKVDSTRLRSATLSEPDWARIGKAHTRLTGAPLVLDDDSTATVGAIRARARRLRARYKDLALVVVDYLQLLGTPVGARVENRQLVVDENTRMLKLLARDLAVPVLATSQVSRAVEARADKRPMLSDLRESGAIESHSDVVAALYRDELYNPASSDRGMAELNLLKHRNGPTGCVRLAFLGAYTMFASAARP